MLIFRQLFDPQSSTYTYLLADEASAEAILIDPVFEQEKRDIALLKELGLSLKYVLDTHCHADHITSAWMLRQKTGAQIVISKHSGVDYADCYVGQNDQIKFGSRYVTVRETPGHTDGCVTYVLDDETKAFTGDCLLIRGCGRTDFQQGETNNLYKSVHEQIFSLPDTTLLYPAHDYKGLTVTSVSEERKYNPRLGGKLSESDFAGFMNNLNLPHPRQIDIALPANLKSGKPDQEIPETGDVMWADIHYSFAGIPEIEPEELEEIMDKVQILDVREQDEYDGPLGHLPNAKHIPLGSLEENLDKLEKEKPIITICRAGGRSAQATNILKKSGYEKVANLSGGMLRWCSEVHTTEGQVD